MSTLPGTPFRLEADPAMLADLRTRLEMTRFPAQQSGPDWATGTPLAYMRRLRDYWLNEFDWNRWVDRINQFEQRMVEVRGERIHVIVEQGSGDNPVPLLMTSGWPGSVIEFLDVIDRLAHPERHGGRVEDAFTVIAPSLPGYGLSPAPSHAMPASEMAGLWSALMVEAFGFARYVAYGSDWGSMVTARMAFDQPANLAGVMLTITGATPDFAAGPPMAPEEQAWAGALRDVQAREGAYQQIQATKPQSLAYAQTDSPIGLAAWIIEKFQGWSVHGTQEDPPFPMDVLVANIMLYWINGSLAPSWLYMFMTEITVPRRERAKVPAVFMVPPTDMFPPVPRATAERLYDVAGYRLAGKGHFPGLDSADDLVSALTELLRPLAHGG